MGSALCQLELYTGVVALGDTLRDKSSKGYLKCPPHTKPPGKVNGTIHKQLLRSVLAK
jgi:hypothetical protein